MKRNMRTSLSAKTATHVCYRYPFITGPGFLAILFDSVKHLAYEPLSSVLSLVHYPKFFQSSPFALLSRKAVLLHCRGLFSPETLQNCLHHGHLPGSVQICGTALRYASFVCYFWTSPEVFRSYHQQPFGDWSRAAMSYEICHTNVQLGPGGFDAMKEMPIDPLSGLA